ncbi:hypothetical protein DDE05_56785, partial [Streptomyces cavourensis]
RDAWGHRRLLVVGAAAACGGRLRDHWEGCGPVRGVRWIMAGDRLCAMRLAERRFRGSRTMFRERDEEVVRVTTE